MTLVVIIVVLCLVIMCKWINCLWDLSMMNCSGDIGMYTARVSARNFFDGPRPLFEDHAHLRWTTPTFNSKHPRSLMKGKKIC